jgi:hypothetical protein
MSVGLRGGCGGFAEYALRATSLTPGRLNTCRCRSLTRPWSGCRGSLSCPPSRPARPVRRREHRLPRRRCCRCAAGRQCRGRRRAARSGVRDPLGARRLGAERIVSMSRNPARQEIALAFGATEVVTERGEEGCGRDPGPVRRHRVGHRAGVCQHRVVVAAGHRRGLRRRAVSATSAFRSRCRSWRSPRCSTATSSIAGSVAPRRAFPACRGTNARRQGQRGGFTYSARQVG